MCEEFSSKNESFQDSVSAADTPAAAEAAAAALAGKLRDYFERLRVVRTQLGAETGGDQEPADDRDPYHTLDV